ncbi:MAG: Tetratricopeptide 2 repeat protein [Pedosphaera sp.]|nr:Tetratricopeptide 2 repeat protein [Pedosphaera sp.]
MKPFFSIMILLLLALAPAAWADAPDDQYVHIYTLIQQGDTLNEKGELASAVAKFAEAQAALKRFQANYPDWNVKVVKYRLNYLNAKIAEISPKTAPPPAAPVTQTATMAPVAPSNAAPAQPSEAENQIKALQDQVRHIEADKALLQAKLKEALSAQPAMADPRELAKAQDQVKELQKQNELLKFSLANVKTNTTQVAAPVTDQARLDLAEANRKLAALAEANASLEKDKAALQSHLSAPPASDPVTVALREENEVLKKQLAGMKSKDATAPKSGDLNRKLQEAQTQLAALESDKAILRLEKIALENRVKQMTAAAPVENAIPPAPVVDAESADKIKQLESQRDELQKRLEIALKEISGRKKGKDATRVDEMSRDLASLRARLEVFEAHQVPYSAEELELFSKPENALVAAVHMPGKKSVKAPPANAAVLLAQAKDFWLAHQLDKAEEKYLQVLKLDEKNVTTLADLASIQADMNKTDEAEKNLKTALAVDPTDDYSLFVLGHMKFRAAKYDEALDAFSRAAQISPQNAKIQNYLGLALSEKGLRGPAETALRKAIQIDPGYADAHINLAVIYITQKPPLAELARWHYDKAVAAGHVHEPKLEKLLEPEKSTAGTAP